MDIPTGLVVREGDRGGWNGVVVWVGDALFRIQLGLGNVFT